MNLFALRREYQRSFERIFEDFSVHDQEQTEQSTEEVKNNRPGGYEFIHHDAKAWACLLDNKRKQ